jgi:Zn-dependent peptidase ImmA (M78 family)
VSSYVETHAIYTMTDFLRHETLEAFDIEGAATDLLLVCRQDGNDSPDPIDIIISGLRFDISDQPPEGHCGWLDIEGACIYYRSHSDSRQERWRMAHELAHLALALRGIARNLHDEGLVDQVARAIVLPRQALERRLRAAGGSPYSYWVTREYPCVPHLQLLQRAVELGF